MSGIRTNLCEILFAMFFGLKAAGWVIVLQGLSAYAAIISSYCFIYPVVRSQKTDLHLGVLSRVKTDRADVKALVTEARDSLEAEAGNQRKSSALWNYGGIAILATSLLLLTGAVIVQIGTDPAFHAEITPSTSGEARPATGQKR